MNYFRILDLDRGADETAIKRAYARLLKATRPDDDPQGFQRLNEAYQAALAHARQPPMEWDEDEREEIQDPAILVERAHAMAATPARQLAADGNASQTRSGDSFEPTPVPTREESVRFDFDAFYRETLEQANGWNDAALLRWLSTREDLYHLGLKQAVGSAFFQRLQDDPDAIVPPDRIDALCGFFGISENYWWSRRMAVRWAIKRENTAFYGEPRPLALRELRRPFSLWRAVLASCMPGLSKRIATLGGRLSSEYGKVPEALDEAQLDFHRRQADPAYFGRNRWLQVMLRSMLAGMVGYGIGALLTTGQSTSSHNLSRIPEALLISGFTALTVAILSLAWQGFVRLHAISLGPEARQAGWRGLLPLWIALTALLLDFVLPSDHWLAYLLVIPAALLHWRRTFDAVRYLLGGMWMAFTMLEPGGALSPPVLGFAMVPVGIAAFDGLYARNHGIPLAAAVGNRWTTIASYAFFFGWLLLSWLRK